MVLVLQYIITYVIWIYVVTELQYFNLIKERDLMGDIWHLYQASLLLYHSNLLPKHRWALWQYAHAWLCHQICVHEVASSLSSCACVLKTLCHDFLPYFSHLNLTWQFNDYNLAVTFNFLWNAHHDFVRHYLHFAIYILYQDALLMATRRALSELLDFCIVLPKDY